MWGYSREPPDIGLPYEMSLGTRCGTDRPLAGVSHRVAKHRLLYEADAPPHDLRVNSRPVRFYGVRLWLGVRAAFHLVKALLGAVAILGEPHVDPPPI